MGCKLLQTALAIVERAMNSAFSRVIRSGMLSRGRRGFVFVGVIPLDLSSFDRSADRSIQMSQSLGPHLFLDLLVHIQINRIPLGLDF